MAPTFVPAKQQPKVGKWHLKKWYVVHAPPLFNLVEIGEVPADDPNKLLNRTVEITLFDITRDLSHLHIKLKFQIHHVEDERAYTRFKGLELTRDYVKSLIRRGSSLIQLIQDLHTKDDAHLRVTVIALTPTRCKSSQKRAIRKLFMNWLDEFARNNTFDNFIRAAVFGEIQVNLHAIGKKIYPLRKVEVYKIKVLKYPPEAGIRPVERIAVAEAPQQVSGSQGGS